MVQEIATLKAALKTTEEKKEWAVQQAEKYLKAGVTLRKSNARYRTKIKRLERTLEHRDKLLKSRFRDDQIAALGRHSTRGLRWSSDSYKEGMVFKMKWGSQGYKDFIKRYPILPSARTLQERVQGMNFDSGLLEEVFTLLESEVPKMPDHHRHCAVFTDEMAIKEGEVWDPATRKFIGKCTFPPHQGLAKKALVVMLAGLTSRWKYAAAYYLTSSLGKERKKGDESNETGYALRDIIFDVIGRAEGIQLKVHVAINDMGPDNLALWKALGIKCTPSGEVQCWIPHPTRPKDKLWFMPDPIHLYKNILSMLGNNKVFTLSQDTVQEENLTVKEVRLQDLQDLVSFESEFELKVAYRLKKENLECKNQFKKMKVGTSRSVFNKRTQVGLEMQAAHCGKSNDATTFFVGLVNEWFDLVSNRGRQLALRKDNEEAYNKALGTLRKVIKVFMGMKIGKKGIWKPIQRGTH